MIHFTVGNLFESKAQTLVNTVNCVGVMGKGIAKEFRDRWPEMFKEYQAACRRGELRSGHPHLYRELDRQILNVPTKDNWKEPSKYEFVEAGLKAIRDHYQEWGIASLAVPPLGCGLGGLEWKKVKALIERYLGVLPIDVDVYEPLPDKDMKLGPAKPKKEVYRVKMTLPLVLLGEVVHRARKAMPSTVPLGKLLVQKFAFFAQLAGAPMRLRFAKYKYGPYDYNVHHMIERLEGLFVRDQSPSWAKSDLRLLDEGGWKEATIEFKSDIDQYSAYLDAAVNLLKDRSIRDVELLATVQYAWCALVVSGSEGTEREVEEYIGLWSKEKKDKFPEGDVKAALEQLWIAGWLGPLGPGEPSPLVDPSPTPGEAVLA